MTRRPPALRRFSQNFLVDPAVASGIVEAADVPDRKRQALLDRLYDAYQDDGYSYLESIGELWGRMCGSPAVASRWADRLMPLVKMVNADRRAGAYAYSKATSACLSALLAAGRHDDLLALIDDMHKPMWFDLRFGVEALRAIIGARWEGMDAATGGRRIDDPADFVRIEIEAAIGRSIPVVPVLIDDTEMPSANDLPEPLQPLAFRNAAELRAGRDLNHHLDLLLRGLQQHLAPGTTRSDPPELKPPPHEPAATGTATLRFVRDTGWFGQLTAFCQSSPQTTRAAR